MHSNNCGAPTQLQTNVLVTNSSDVIITFSCEPGYTLHGSTTSQCVAGEWTPSPDTVMCIADQNVTSSMFKLVNKK